jgi:hypothetical protein
MKLHTALTQAQVWQCLALAKLKGRVTSDVGRPAGTCLRAACPEQLVADCGHQEGCEFHTHRVIVTAQRPGLAARRLPRGTGEGTGDE